jgi:hypothetical protein
MNVPICVEIDSPSGLILLSDLDSFGKDFCK